MALVNQSVNSSMVVDEADGADLNKENTAIEELKFYEALIAKYRESSAESLLTKRTAIAKNDPSEELIDLRLEVQEQERQLREMIKIAS